jgi:hypothetical protein
MSGLGCGSLTGARVADRLTRVANFAAFAAVYVAPAIAIMVALFGRAQAPAWLLEKDEFALSPAW